LLRKYQKLKYGNYFWHTLDDTERCMIVKEHHGGGEAGDRLAGGNEVGKHQLYI